MYSPTIQKLIDLFSKFPTVGPRTAARFVFYLINKSKEELAETSSQLPERNEGREMNKVQRTAPRPGLQAGRGSAIEELIKLISDLKKNVKICPLCFNPFEKDGEFCPICSNPSRDKSLLCIVANEIDLQAIEKTKKYQGLYFILGGTVSRLKKKDIEKLRIKELQERIKKEPQIKEIILALNPTPEGEATALYLERLLKPFNKKISRLGRGLPIGGELEYADEETISWALESRK